MSRELSGELRVTLPVCRVQTTGTTGEDRLRALADQEWLVTNGIGGYSSGTVAGVVTRRYHGLLVAALPNPLGRMVMFNALEESFDIDQLVEFRLDGGVPTWHYAWNDGRGKCVVEKRVMMPYRQNTVLVWYRSLGDAPVRLRLSPAVHFRAYEAPVSTPLHDDYTFATDHGLFRLTAAGLPPLRFHLDGECTFEANETRRQQVLYPMEELRGYAARGDLWSPGSFLSDLAPGASIALCASVEDEDVMLAMTAAQSYQMERERKQRLVAAAPPAVRDDGGRDGGGSTQLVIAADQFVIRPVGRVRDTIRAAAVGDEVRTVIAGYHWFTDWGRDTMISLEGLTLTTGRHREAGFILRTFAQYVCEGLIPNLFPDGSDKGLYHTADATLWFFHALDRYGEVTGYWPLVEQALPAMREIVEAHMRGTAFGIGVDPKDRLLSQGAEGYQLTWMDAKVDGWVVTPRRGKAVEINALWYNALSHVVPLGARFRRRGAFAMASRGGGPGARVVQPALLE